MAPRIELIHVKPALPPRLEMLQSLAFNLRWSWDPDAAEVFERLDRDAWERSGQNPVRMLGTISQERLLWAAEDPVFLAHMDRAYESLQDLLRESAWFQRRHREHDGLRIAYFSAEFGIAECLPLYSGGLGVLAGDHIKSASDLGVPLVGVGLAYKQGYFTQYLNADGWQQEAYVENDFYNMPLTLERDEEGKPLLVSVQLDGKTVHLQIWRAQVGRVPLYLLDSNVAENAPEERLITHQLYGGDRETRIRHEIVLGIGGLRALHLLGLPPDVCHINEGHAAFLAVERAKQIMAKHGLSFAEARQVVSATSIFTTHTPVPAGFDVFGRDLMTRYFHGIVREMGISMDELMRLGSDETGEPQKFNMALFAVRHAAFRNAVSVLHGKTSRKLWEKEWGEHPLSEIPVDSVTNGIHTRTWISRQMRDLLNRYLGPDWSVDPTNRKVWDRVDTIPDEELWRTHIACKERLVSFARRRLEEQVRRKGGSTADIAKARRVLDSDALTVGFGRRFATYKRATLLFRDVERVQRIAKATDRPVQFIFGGKAHPQDNAGKELIKEIVHRAAEDLRGSVVFLENYDMHVARHLVQGVDVWLNTPRRPHEASGTSGMKAAANAVLNVSIMDGWWDEGFDPEVGWRIGLGEEYDDEAYQDEVEANALHDLLEREVVPLFYERRGTLPEGWIAKMKASMRRLAPVFNTNRMVAEYTDRYYIAAARRGRDFLGGDLSRVRDLVAWTRFVGEHWKEVAVRRVERDSNGPLRVGSAIPVVVEVSLGSLRPEDVSVELYHGPVTDERELDKGTVTPLLHQGGENGSFRYEGVLPCRESGLYGYAVRVRPAHRDALIPHEVTLITWF